MNSVASLLLEPFSKRSFKHQMETKRLGRPIPEIKIAQNIKCKDRQYTRSFNIELFKKHEWLCACDKKEALYCFPCLLFCVGEDSWTKSGVTDINHLSGLIKKHELSAKHMKNVVLLSLFGNANIVAQLDSEYIRNIALQNEKVKHNRYILNIIINCVRFCGAFELALRGINESETASNPGIFRGLINFSAELDDALKNHLEKATVFKDSSKTIQNEILQVMLDVCHEEISKEIREANYLAIIADETSDVANMFQIAIVFRYIVKGKPVERFWDFLTPLKQTVASCILKELGRHINENPDKLIAQTYDGASVMSGSRHGVQADVKEVYQCAAYVHCYAHELNLVMLNAASIKRNVRIFFSNLQGICTFFSNCPQGTFILDGIVKKGTKWNFHSGSVNVVFEHRAEIIECMRRILDGDEIKNASILAQASGQIQTLTSDSFVYWLSLFNKIIPQVEKLFGQLQNKAFDPTLLKKSINTFEENIQRVRSSIDIVDHCEATTSPSTSKKRKEDEELNWDSKFDPSLLVKTCYDENMADSSYDINYHCEAYTSTSNKRKVDEELNWESKEVCDVIIYQARDRFSFTGHLVAATLFRSEKFSQYRACFPENHLKGTIEAYPFLDLKKLRTELSVIYSTPEFRGISGAVVFFNFITENNIRETFSECVKLLEILLTIPMASSEEERCFSTLKRIRTFLRNTMCQERLSALAMLSQERDFISEIPDFNQKVMDKFAANEERKMDFLYK